MKKIGIYSGTFDPPHNGHLSFALDALKKCGLDKVFFLVEPQPRRKQGVKALEHRLAMVQLAIANNPRLGLIIVEQARFTPQDTLPVLKARFKGARLCLLAGGDMLTHLGSWPHVDDLLKSVTFIIGMRGKEKEELTRKIHTIEKTRGIKFAYELFKTELSSVSSSKIRLAIKRNLKVNELDPNVLEYIRQHNLYALSDSS